MFWLFLTRTTYTQILHLISLTLIISFLREEIIIDTLRFLPPLCLSTASSNHLDVFLTNYNYNHPGEGSMQIKTSGIREDTDTGVVLSFAIQRVVPQPAASPGNLLKKILSCHPRPTESESVF